MADQDGNNLVGAPLEVREAYCVACGVGLDGGARRRDLGGNSYCAACFLDLRHGPDKEDDGDQGATAPHFRCTVCGGVSPASGFVEQAGRLVCKACMPSRAAAVPAVAPSPAGNRAGTVDEGPGRSPAGDPAPDPGRDPGRDPDAAQIVATLEGRLPDNLLRKVTCPHCWHTFPPEQVLWVSEHADLFGDPVAGPEAQVRFRPSRFTASGEALDARGMPCQLLACPRCHLVIPRALLETDPLFVSTVGAPGSGKSHFLASMTWQLRRLLPTRFSVTFNDADTLNNHALNAYESTLFLQEDLDRPVALRKTELQGELYDQVRLGRHVISLPRPFVFTLRPAGAGTGGTGGAGGGDRRVRVMCLYDNAGEHFRPGMDSSAAPGTQHLAKSGVVLFLFDPTQHPRFRRACRKVSHDPQLSGEARAAERQEIALTEAAARIRRYRGLSSRDRHDRPLVVVLSKVDIWAPLLRLNLSREPLVSEPGDGGGNGAARFAVDLARIESVSKSLRKMLMRLAPEFVAAAEDFWPEVVYIPVSALGGSPRQDRKTGLFGVRPRDVRPQWVTVPVLYMFAKWGAGLLPAPSPRAGADGDG